MKVKTLALAAGTSALLVTGAASADFLGIDVVKFTDYLGGTGDGEVLPGNHGRTIGAHPNVNLHGQYAASGFQTYRLYATFSTPGHWVASVGTSATPANAGSVNAKSGTFWHFQEEVYGEIQPPAMLPQGAPPAGDELRIADTYITIGLHAGPGAPGATAFAPGPGEWRSQTNDMGNGLSSFGYQDSGVFISPDSQSQGTASLTPQGIDPDGLYRVLVMQLTVADMGDPKLGIEGTLGFMGVFFAGDSNATELTGDAVVFASGQQVPGPGALALLGLAGLVGARRRR
jgi:MYXO-CTERM domain-containing protein